MPTGTPTKMKECKLCGKMFLPKKPSQKFCEDDHIQQCPVCRLDTVWNSTRPVEPCSKACRKEQTRRNNIQKFGVEHPMQSKQVQANHRNSMLQKYGAESPLQCAEIRQKAIDTNRKKFGADWAAGSPEVQQRIQRTMEQKYGATSALAVPELRAKGELTCLDRYGFKYPTQSPQVKDKTAGTNLAKYGYTNPMSNPEIARHSVESRVTPYSESLEKAKATWMNKYGVDNPAKNKAVMDKVRATWIARYGATAPMKCRSIHEKIVKTSMERYGVPYYIMSPDCPKPNKKMSATNHRFAQLLEEENIRYIMEHPIGDKSFDFYLPDDRLLIEVDPTYTHNAIGSHFGEGRSFNYHSDKSRLASDNGLRCIHVFDWDNAAKIVKSLRFETYVPRSAYQVREVDAEAAKQFIDKYALYETSLDSQFVGVYFNDKLIQLLGFQEYVSGCALITMFDTKFKFAAQDSLKSMIDFIAKTCCISEFTTRVDLSKSDGSNFENAGFKKLLRESPTVYWSKGRHAFSDEFVSVELPDIDMRTVAMTDAGYLPVANCGMLYLSYKVE